MRQPEGGQHVGQGPSARSSEVPSRTRPRGGRVEQAFGPFVGVRMMRACTSRLRPSLVSASDVGVAHEQPPVQRLLQLAHVFADGGLGQASRRAASVKLGAAAAAAKVLSQSGLSMAAGNRKFR